ncbi:hypothetical protein M419DRAFT_92785 [Trichoderma reesei RUT C-30]|uniref:Uncharacterized protein n=1 Tax=Hypocrea jecorina (strain ATCC 56765 / BCRC 32924 / NRRL 11460 / Rut C-30) TaxID=1344414 RepID=A0A024RYH7_HYPJR|nr:hypothetical protein M419DRAFT_92785 [Trichoderma reesei RUT C-30]
MGLSDKAAKVVERRGCRPREMEARGQQRWGIRVMAALCRCSTFYLLAEAVGR